MSTITRITAEELAWMPQDGYRCELIAGELRKITPAGWQHGAVGGRLHSLLAEHNLGNKLGEIFLAETGFVLARDPDTVRAPDIAFIHRDHMPTPLPDETFWPGAPDLAVEVVSPGDTVAEVAEKARAWLDAGAMAVWVVDPAGRNVTVYRSPADVKILTENDELTGEDVVPGFSCRVGDVFVN